MIIYNDGLPIIVPASDGAEAVVDERAAGAARLPALARPGITEQALTQNHNTRGR